MKVLGLIPTRLGSTRLPAKPLLEISGIPLIIHTYKRAMLSKKFDDVIICCDDKKISNVAKKFKAKCVLTSKHHNNGTERITEVLLKQKKTYDLIVDIQGDEPLISPHHIDKVIDYHKKNFSTDIILPTLKIKLADNQNLIKVEEDISKGYVSIKQSNRKHNPKFSMHSVYTKRQREKTRLDKDYVLSFLKAADTYSLKTKVKLKGNKVTRSFLSENIVESLDRFSFERDINETSVDIENIEEMESYFNNFSANSLAPEFYPEDRSIKQVNKAIYQFFWNEFQINFEQHQFQIMEIVLSKKNIKHFRNAIEDAKALYQEIQEEKDNILEVLTDWNIPKKIDYQNDVTEQSVKKSIMMPFFYNKVKLSNPESYFISYLDESKDVLWWYKNGEKESKYFAVPYKDESITKPFFVDFIIMLKNKRIGFFDTKSGTYLNEAMTDGKNDGLLDFLKSDSNYFGGIVTNTKDDGSGVWKVFKKPSQKFIRGDLKNWENLNF